jgi:DnaK suppressor protein
MDRRDIDIDRVTQKLRLRRQQILEFLKRLDDEVQELDTDSAQDIADRSVLSMSRESLFDRTSQQRIVLRMVEGALGRISDGSFGVCANCGDDIAPRRLEALPWTQYCLRCQENIEDEGRYRLSGQASQMTHSPEKDEPADNLDGNRG